MSESEHFDSEFSYPGEISNAEMLQLPTHSEATERKSLLSKGDGEDFSQAERPLMIQARQILNARTIYWFPQEAT